MAFKHPGETTEKAPTDHYPTHVILLSVGDSTESDAVHQNEGWKNVGGDGRNDGRGAVLSQVRHRNVNGRGSVLTWPFDLSSYCF